MRAHTHARTRAQREIKRKQYLIFAANLGDNVSLSDIFPRRIAKSLRKRYSIGGQRAFRNNKIIFQSYPLARERPRAYGGLKDKKRSKREDGVERIIGFSFSLFLRLPVHHQARSLRGQLNNRTESSRASRLANLYSRTLRLLVWNSCE